MRLLTILLMAVTLAPAGVVQAQSDSLPPGVTQTMVEQGRTLFAGQGLCLACHGVDARGLKGMGADLTDEEWLHADGTFDGIVARITTGVTAQESSNGLVMPPRGGGLNEEQVRAVAAYVWTLSRPKPTGDPSTGAGRM